MRLWLLAGDMQQHCICCLHATISIGQCRQAYSFDSSSHYVRVMHTSCICSCCITATLGSKWQTRQCYIACPGRNPGLESFSAPQGQCVHGVCCPAVASCLQSSEAGKWRNMGTDFTLCTAQQLSKQDLDYAAHTCFYISSKLNAPSTPFSFIPVFGTACRACVGQLCSFGLCDAILVVEHSSP